VSRSQGEEVKGGIKGENETSKKKSDLRQSEV